MATRIRQLWGRNFQPGAYGSDGWRRFIAISVLAALLAACDSASDGETVVNIVAGGSSEPPRVVGANSTGNTTVLLSYSQPMADSALNAENYAIGILGGSSGGLLIESLAFSGPDATAVEIVTLSQSGVDYEISVHNISSQSGDAIASDARAEFAGTAPGVGERVDTDGDGLSDDIEQLGWTIRVLRSNGVDIEEYEATSDPTAADTDEDGVSDFDERRLGMNPRDADTDHDGLDDLLEFSVLWSSSTKQDTDGDGLPDLDEYQNYRTSPIMSDTDGDGFSDLAEIVDFSSEPLIADVPQAVVQLVGELDMHLNVTYSDSQGTVDTYSTKLVNEQTTSDSISDTWMDRYSLEQSSKISGGLEGSTSDGGKASVGSEVSATEGYVQERTTVWTQSSSETARQESDRQRSESRNRTETASTATISAGIQVTNTSEIAFSLRNLSVTLLQIDPVNRSSFRTLSTLNLDDAISDGITLGPFNGQSGILQIANAEASAALVKELLANPTGISLEVASFDLLDENDRNFAFLAQETNSRTALISIDFGNGTIERYRVATDVEREQDGTAAGLRLGTAFSKILGLEPGVDYETAPIDILVNDEIVNEQGLVRIRDVATPVGDPDDVRFWVVLGSDDRHVAPGVDFNDILLRGGDSLFIGFVEDKDQDGLYAREEYLLGTSDENPDTDGDGLTDFEEAKEGWLVIRDDVVRVYSDPLNSDSDRDGLTDIEERDSPFGATDPRDADTDSDGLCDGPGTPFSDPNNVCRRSNRDPNPLQPALTQPPQITFLNPIENSVGASTTTDIFVSFDQPLAPGGSPIITGLSTGARHGVAAQADNDRTIIFDPDGEFGAGETVEVTLPGTIENVDRFPLAPKVFRFTTATSMSSPGRYTAPRIFQTGTDINGYNPGPLVAADFNGDGREDIAVGEYDDQAVVVLLNEGQSNFNTDSRINVIGGPTGIAAADFDADGRIDLVTSNGDSGSVSILLNIGNGRHLNFSQYGLFTTASAVAVGDFDGNSWIDIAAASAAGDGNTLRILFNNGDRTFTPSESVDLGTLPEAIVAADIDGDGIDDIVVPSGRTGDCGVNSPGNGDVTVLISDGSRSPLNYTSSTYAALGADFGWSEAIAVSDFDQDGAMDVVVGATIWDDPGCWEVTNGAVVMLRNINDGSGALGAPVRYAAPYSGGIAVADWDGDGNEDVGFNSASNIAFLAGNGDGSFSTLTMSNGGNRQGGIVAADFDDDGSADVAVSSGPQIIVRLNSGVPGQFEFNNAPEFNPQVLYTELASADMNDDGIGDFVTLEFSRIFSGSKIVAAHISNGDGTLAPAPFSVNVVASSAVSQGFLNRLVLADVDGNGATDIVLTHDLSTTAFDPVGKTDDRIEVMLNIGNGVFAPPNTLLSGGLGPVDITSGDFDGDGDFDLAIAHEGDYVYMCANCVAAEFRHDHLVILSNENNTGFTTSQVIDGAGTDENNAFELIDSTDVDGDGDLDLVLISRNRWVEIYLNDGLGTFQRDPGKRFRAGSGDIVDMLAADLDRDLDVDLAFASSSGPFGLAVHLNDGSGGFNNSRLFMPGAAIARRMSAGDFNGDNSIDLVIAGEVEKLSMMLNDGAGFFDEEVGYVGSIGLIGGVAAGDIDGDGDLDLGVVGRRDNATAAQGVTLLINE